VEKSEIYKGLMSEWVGILLQLWEAFGKVVDPKQLKVYIAKLKDVPLGILEHIVEIAIRNHHYNSVPTLAEVVDVLNEYHPYYQNEVYLSSGSRPFRDIAEKEREYRQLNPMTEGERKTFINNWRKYQEKERT